MPRIPYILYSVEHLTSFSMLWWSDGSCSIWQQLVSHFSQRWFVPKTDGWISFLVLFCCRGQAVGSHFGGLGERLTKFHQSPRKGSRMPKEFGESWICMRVWVGQDMPEWENQWLRTCVQGLYFKNERGKEGWLVEQNLLVLQTASKIVICEVAFSNEGLFLVSPVTFSVHKSACHYNNWLLLCAQGA